jgi:hypothetical protein
MAGKETFVCSRRLSGDNYICRFGAHVRTLFAAVWLEVEALLRQDAGLQAKTIWTD